MKTCPRCQTANADSHHFCQQCGRPVDSAAPASDATVHWSVGRLPERLPRHTVSVAALFASKDRLVIGRAPDCDVCLPHPTVSRYHALVERCPDGLRVQDLGSVNGVTVAGRRVTEPALVREGELVGIGPFMFSLRDGVVHSLDSSRSLRLEAFQIEKVVSLGGGRTRKLLDEVSLVINPGEFVSLLGPSGSGKSTLMSCLNGRRRATGGRVLANGEDFYRHFASFRQSLGYVPQKDIVHTQLTVGRALYYTARLRLPPDTDPAELHGRLEKVLAEMELGPHRDTLVANLSGGQVKRVSLGAELLAEPCLLYIDEATSGLDAGTEARMMRLFRGLADQGRSIVCITHNVDHVDACHLVLVLCRGRLVYYGPPAEAPAYFQVGRIGDIYDRLSQKEPAQWAGDFAATSLYREFVQGRLAASATEPPPAEAPTLVPRLSVPGPSEEPPAEGPARAGVLADARKLMSELGSAWPPLADRFRALTARYLRVREVFAPLWEAWHQFRVLTARYVELIRGDARSLRLLLWQAPLVALFLLAGFVHKDYDARIPLPRPLDPSERRVLAALQELDNLLAHEKLTAQQSQALDRARFHVKLEDRTLDLNGTAALGLLRQLRGQCLGNNQRRALEEARFTLEVNGEPVELTGADLAGVVSGMRESHLVGKLLAFNGPVVPDREGIDPRFTYTLLFILVMVVLWFGTNNAAKEIVKEEAIYGRERAVNLGIIPYLASKFLVLSVITIAHAAVLMALVWGTLELLHALAGHPLPAAEHRLGLPAQLGVLSLLAMCGVALGLLLSACVSSPDRANALLPYVLIPQIILGGGILAVDEGPLQWLAMGLSPVYWAYRAVHLGAQLLPAGFPGHVDYPDSAALPCAALLGQTLVLLLLTAWFLYHKEARE
jgi:ABC-type multidrug transport system ATPase subunit